MEYVTFKIRTNPKEPIVKDWIDSLVKEEEVFLKEHPEMKKLKKILNKHKKGILFIVKNLI